MKKKIKILKNEHWIIYTILLGIYILSIFFGGVTLFYLLTKYLGSYFLIPFFVIVGGFIIGMLYQI